MTSQHATERVLKKMGLPSDCDICAQLRQRTRLRARLRLSQSLPVKTWCRICGLPVLINIIHDFESAVRFLYGLDDQIANHVDHEESGGWGVHWRFDEVLEVAFPNAFETGLPYWPAPPWYEHDKAMDQNVIVLTQEQAQSFEKVCEDHRRLDIERELNRRPRTRAELEAEVGPVWDATEVRVAFEILGFRNPFAVALRNEDGMKGSLLFQDNPRYYFSFEASRVI